MTAVRRFVAVAELIPKKYGIAIVVVKPKYTDSSERKDYFHLYNYVVGGLLRATK